MTKISGSYTKLVNVPDKIEQRHGLKRQLFDIVRSGETPRIEAAIMWVGSVPRRILKAADSHDWRWILLQCPLKDPSQNVHAP